jgi:hypothetical protein
LHNFVGKKGIFNTQTKNVMNKKILISLAAISFIADIITLTSAFKWVLIKLFD